MVNQALINSKFATMQGFQLPEVGIDDIFSLTSFHLIMLNLMDYYSYGNYYLKRNQVDLEFSVYLLPQLENGETIDTIECLAEEEMFFIIGNKLFIVTMKLKKDTKINKSTSRVEFFKELTYERLENFELLYREDYIL